MNRWRPKEAAATVSSSRRALWLAQGLVLQLVTLACDALDPADAPGAAETAAGREDAALLFKQHCAACHGVFGRGQVLPSSGETVASRDLSSPQFQAEHSDAQILLTLRRGVAPGMPSFEHVLSEEQLRSLVAHVRELAEAR